MELKRALHLFNRFLSNPTSPLPIALYRICYGGIGVIMAIFLFPDLATWFSDEGVLSQALSEKIMGMDRINVFTWWGSSVDVVHRVFWVYLISSFCVMMGFWTRLSSILMFITLSSFQNRNVYVLHGGDALYRLMSFFMMFAPSAKALSIDRLIAVYKGLEKAGRWDLVNPLAQRVIQLQLCILYFSTAYVKATGIRWTSGTTVYIVQQLSQFHRFPLPAFMHTLTASKILTWFTLAVEGFFPFLIWFKDTRLLMLFLVIILHTGFEYALNIQLFQFIVGSIFLLFFYEEEFCRVGLRIRKMLRPLLPTKIELFYNLNHQFCSRMMNVLTCMDLLQLIEFHPISTAQLLEVKTSKGKILAGFSAVRAALTRILPFMWLAPIGFIPGFKQIGDRLYRFVDSSVWLRSSSAI